MSHPYVSVSLIITVYNLAFFLGGGDTFDFKNILRAKVAIYALLSSYLRINKIEY